MLLHVGPRFINRWTTHCCLSSPNYITRLLKYTGTGGKKQQTEVQRCASTVSAVHLILKVFWNIWRPFPGSSALMLVAKDGQDLLGNIVAFYFESTMNEPCKHHEIMYIYVLRWKDHWS